MNRFSGMPQMGIAFAGWQQKLYFTRRQDSVVDGFVTHKEVTFRFNGTVQPLVAKEIMLKPEGQRAWAWYQIHCSSKVQLDVNSLITYDGKAYKVMGVKDYSLNGYMEYHVVKDYQNG